MNSRSNEYRLARMKRDGRDDLLERISKGELSVHRAAIQAGIVKEPTPLDIIRRQIPKLNEQERAELLHMLDAYD